MSEIDYNTGRQAMVMTAYGRTAAMCTGNSCRNG